VVDGSSDNLDGNPLTDDPRAVVACLRLIPEDRSQYPTRDTPLPCRSTTDQTQYCASSLPEETLLSRRTRSRPCRTSSREEQQLYRPLWTDGLST